MISASLIQSRFGCGLAITSINSLELDVPLSQICLDSLQPILTPSKTADKHGNGLPSENHANVPCRTANEAN